MLLPLYRAPNVAASWAVTGVHFTLGASFAGRINSLQQQRETDLRRFKSSRRRATWGRGSRKFICPYPICPKTEMHPVTGLVQSRARAVETVATTTQSRPAAARIQPAEAGGWGESLFARTGCCDLSRPTACQVTLHLPRHRSILQFFAFEYTIRVVNLQGVECQKHNFSSLPL